MKLRLDLSDKIILNAGTKRTSTEGSNKPRQEIKLQRRSNEEVMANISFTIYTSKGRR